MADRRHGKPSNYQLPDDHAELAEKTILKPYADFGHTLGCVKLAKMHGMTLLKGPYES